MEKAGARCVGLFADKSFDRLMETTMTDQTTRLPVRRALISVSDKTGILEFARELVALNVEILSTGGTYKLLKDNGIAAVEVADYTGFPEMMDGPVEVRSPCCRIAIAQVFAISAYPRTFGCRCSRMSP